VNRRDSVAQLQRNARLLLPLLILSGGLVSGWEFALSVAAGGALADINFSWLKKAVDRALTGNPQSRSGGLLIAGFIARVVLILVGLFAMIHFSFLRVLGAVLGASIFVFAGFIEAAVVLFRRRD